MRRRHRGYRRRRKGPVIAGLLCLVVAGIFIWRWNPFAGREVQNSDPDTTSYTEAEDHTAAAVTTESQISSEDTTEALDTTEELAVSTYLEQMTLREKVSQLIFLHGQGESIETLFKYQVGGIILFDAFFRDKSADQVIQGIEDMQSVMKIPMLVAVDEEGGSVVRVSNHRALSTEKFQSPRRLYREGGMDLIREDTIDKSELLRGYGINVNLAPVADVSVSGSDYIHDRAFGKNAEETADYVSNVVTEMQKCGIGSVVKHFPGYGNNRDTHKHFVKDRRDYATFEKSDLIPFEAAIEAGVNGVLVSHNIVECMDDTYPASLSPAVHRLLREKMGFDGVIMTDDLVMKAIQKAEFDQEPAVLAFAAGNDMIISSDYENDMQAVVDAVQDGTLSQDAIDESVKRVLAWKNSLGLLQTPKQTPADQVSD